MKQHFYFFRHGQTNENKAGATYGNALEAYLTDDGIAQAKNWVNIYQIKILKSCIPAP